MVRENSDYAIVCAIPWTGATPNRNSFLLNGRPRIAQDVQGSVQRRTAVRPPVRPATSTIRHMPKRFKGIINVDVRESTPDWEPYLPPRAKEGSPNIL